jgi:hypothetical protein
VENGERLSPPPPHPHPHPLWHLWSTPSWKEFLPPPPCLCGSTGNAFEPFFLLSSALPSIFGMIGLPPHHILEQGDPSWVAMYTSMTLQHEHSRCQKGRN